MQCDEAMGGANEFHVARTVSKLIRHHFGNGELLDRVRDRRLKSLREGGAANGVSDERVLGLALAPTLHLIERRREAFFLQPLRERRCGVAAGIESDFHRHEFLRFAAFGRLRGHLGDQHA